MTWKKNWTYEVKLEMGKMFLKSNCIFKKYNIIKLKYIQQIIKFDK